MRFEDLDLCNLPNENLHFEYKEVSQDTIPKSAWKTVSSFANTDGGFLFFGIKERKQNLTIVGINNPFKIKQDFITTQRNRKKISKACVKESDIREINHNGKTVLVIYVPKVSVDERPVFLNNDINQSYIREGEADIKVSKDELRFFIREADTTLDAELLNNYSLDDLNLKDLKLYRNLIDSRESDNYSDLTDQEFLQHIGLIDKDRSIQNGEYKLKKAALLLFGKFNAIRSVFPSFFIDLIIKPYHSSVDYSDRIYTSNDFGYPQNIFSFFNKAWEKIDAVTPNSFQLKDATRVDMGDKLKRVLREALVNTLVHADYSAKTQIKISIFKDYFEFENPGDMRISVKDFELGGHSNPRNPNIMMAFVKARLGERTGSGGYRIYKTANDLKLTPPEIITDIHETKLIIYNAPFIDTILSQLPEEWRPMYKRINEKLIVKYADVKDLGKTRYQVNKILDGLVKKGLVEKSGKGKGTTYSMPQNSPAVRMGLNSYLDFIQNEILH